MVRSTSAQKVGALKVEIGKSGSGRRRTLWTLCIVFLTAAVLQAAADWYRDFRSSRSEPGLGASWIWAADTAKEGEPTAFMAVRDFELDSSRQAWIQVTVDEGYILWVNGLRVGSGLYQEGRPADLYEISSWLKLGWNRLMIEASSSRGAGGLLASLRFDEPDSVALVSDREWRIFERCEPWLLGGTKALQPEDGAVPQIWQLPPTGRWRPPATLALAQTLAERRGLSPTRLRHPAATAASNWRQLAPDEPLPHLGSQVVLDFGRPVTGHLTMGIDDAAGPAVLFFDLLEPTSPTDRSPSAVLAAVPGLREWHDPVARTFRYVTLVGARPVGWARVRPAAAPDPTVELERGVFGLQAESPYRRVAESVWSRLNG